MAVLAWVMMGLAIWHFTIFLPDRFWSGIVGAFLGALFGAALFGFVINGFSVPDIDDTTIVVAIEGIPGAPPDLRDPPVGCRFHPRCRYAMDVCMREDPPHVGAEDAYAACWWVQRQRESAVVGAVRAPIPIDAAPSP